MNEEERDTYIFGNLINKAEPDYATVSLHEGGHFLGYTGCFLPSNDRYGEISIYHINKTHITEQLYTLAHEIGHAIDNYQNGIIAEYNEALVSWQEGTLTSIQRELILYQEDTAWVNGSLFLMYCDGCFRNIADMEKARKNAILTYKRVLKLNTIQKRYVV